MTTRTAATCNASEVGATRPLKSDEFCAGSSSGSPGTCGGDSGGPLIRAIFGGYELVGVTSWGAHYCTDYSVFGRINTSRLWIRTYVPA